MIAQSASLLSNQLFWYFKIFMTGFGIPFHSISSKKVIYFAHHLGIQKISCYTGTKTVRDLTKLYSKTLQLYCKQMYQKGLPTGNMIGFRLWILKWWIEATFQGQCQTKKNDAAKFPRRKSPLNISPSQLSHINKCLIKFWQAFKFMLQIYRFRDKKETTMLCVPNIYTYIFIYIYIHIYIHIYSLKNPVSATIKLIG